MARFRHAHQLVQLRTLDPDAHRRAARLANTAPGTAAKIIVGAMQAALTRLAYPRRPGIPLPPGIVLYDLAVAVKKYGYGLSTNGQSPILWYKLAGQPKKEPAGWTMAKLVSRGRLDGFELIDTEVKINMIVYRYRRADRCHE